MFRSPSGRRASVRVRVRLVVLGLGVGAVVATTVAPVQAAPRPPNPSTAQLTHAHAAKRALARQVSSLGGKIAAIDVEVSRLDHGAQLAEQRYALALQNLREATQNATEAKTSVALAQHGVEVSRDRLQIFLRTSFIDGRARSGGDLLTAGNPSQILERTDLARYTAVHQRSALAEMNLATVAKSNADAAARQAVTRRTDLTGQADRAKDTAFAALNASVHKRTTLAASRRSYAAQLATAQMRLLGLQHQRAKFQAWQRVQARLQAAREAAARLRAFQAAAASSGPMPAGGAWTAARGQRAVNRAKAYLGMRYSFAAGNRAGPTLGVCSNDDGWNDCHVRGFDCSGLTIYAWAPYLGMDHFAATQYTQVGSYHPAVANLMAGDLVFWSGDGTIGGIGHVAMYIGGGDVIQAPHSGDIIRITKLSNVEDGYYGATRPLSCLRRGNSGLADRCRAEHQHPAAHVVGGVLTFREQALQHLGVLGVDREYLFPGALVEHQLQGEDAVRAGLLGDPGELVVAQVTHADAVVRDGLGNVRGAGLRGHDASLTALPTKRCADSAWLTPGVARAPQGEAADVPTCAQGARPTG